MPRKKAASRFVLSEHLSSPINLPPTPDYNAPQILFNYPDTVRCELTATNLVLTALIAEQESSTASITINDKTYTLRQFHVHVPSEHTIADVRHTMEWHFVHQTETGEFAVVGVFMDAAAATTHEYVSLFKALSQQESACVVNPRALIPASSAYWHYQGTLTTPPFDPVYWTVAQEITRITEEDLLLLQKTLAAAQPQ